MHHHDGKPQAIIYQAYLTANMGSHDQVLLINQEAGKMETWALTQGQERPNRIAPNQRSRADRRMLTERCSSTKSNSLGQEE